MPRFYVDVFRPVVFGVEVEAATMEEAVIKAIPLAHFGTAKTIDNTYAWIDASVQLFGDHDDWPVDFQPAADGKPEVMEHCRVPTGIRVS